MSTQAEPQVVNLTGTHFLAYEAGRGFGTAAALTDAAQNVGEANKHLSREMVTHLEATLKALPAASPLRAQLLQLPRMLGVLDGLERALREKGAEHQAAALACTARLQETGVGVPWWKRPAVLAFGGYLVAVVLASTVATLVATAWR